MSTQPTRTTLEIAAETHLRHLTTISPLQDPIPRDVYVDDSHLAPHLLNKNPIERCKRCECALRIDAVIASPDGIYTTTPAHGTGTLYFLSPTGAQAIDAAFAAWLTANNGEEVLVVVDQRNPATKAYDPTAKHTVRSVYTVKPQKANRLRAASMGRLH